MKKSSAMDRLLEEGFFDSREAALPYLMSGAVYCGAQLVTTGGQLVPSDKPMTVRGLYEPIRSPQLVEMERNIEGMTPDSTPADAPETAPVDLLAGVLL